MNKKKLFEQAWICANTNKGHNLESFRCAYCPIQKECTTKPWTELLNLGLYSEYKSWLRERNEKDGGKG